MMRRVHILVLVGACALASATLTGQTRSIAVTIDDLPTVSALGNGIVEAERITRDLVAAVARHKVPAIGFVNERKLRTDGAVDPRRVALLQQWIDAGLELGNHTYSHADLHTTPIDEFLRDVSEGEKITRELLAKVKNR